MSDPVASSAEPEKRRPLWRRLLPLGVLAAAIAIAFAFDLDRYITFDELRENREQLLTFVDRHYVLATLGYIAVYAALVSLIFFPGATILSLTGGFLFGAISATAFTVAGATIGATVVFLVARTAFGDLLYDKAGPAIRRMEDGFRENALSYMLVLRLIPLFPFWLVNLVPGFLGVRLGTYVIATFIGIIPGTFVYCLAGAGVGDVFDSGEDFSFFSIFTPTVIAAFVGLVVLALLPIAYKKFRKRSAS